MLLGGLILVAVAAGGCREEPPPTFRFTVEMEPLEKVEAYGRIVPYRITISSECSVPVFVHRVEALTGWRRVLARLSRRIKAPIREESDGLVRDAKAAETSWVARSGLLFPGGKLAVDRPYRVIDGSEGIFLAYEAAPRDLLLESAWLPRRGGWGRADPEGLDLYRSGLVDASLISEQRWVLFRPRSGEDRVIREGGQRVEIDCPPAPFDPEVEMLGIEGGTDSLALRGFVLRISSAQFQLHRKDGVDPLPPVPIDFFEDLDLATDGIVVLDERGKEATVRADGAAAFLEEVFRARHSIGFSNEPERAKYEIKE